MNNTLFPLAIRKKSLDLLAQAALAPHPRAIAAWRQWRATYDIETTPWHDVRMLGAVAARITDLEPDASIRPRVAGIRKFLWTQSEMCLQGAAGGLAVLEKADVPVLLMKGAARIATDPASAQERLIRDVDILVPTDRQQNAFDALNSAGWSLVPEKWQMEWHDWSPMAAHHAWSLSREKSVIDLHHFSNHLNRLRGDDDGLWARSLPLGWRGADVRVPSPADALLLALVHGIRWSNDSTADWTVDASALLDAGNVDWSVFMAEAEARLLQAALLPGLAYLDSVLCKPVPTDVMRRLQAAVSFEQRAELKQYAGTAIPVTNQQRAIAMHMAVLRVMTQTRRLDAEPDAAGRPRLLASKSVPLAVDSRKHDIELPSLLDGPGNILVQIIVADPNGPAKGPFACTVTAPGLALGTLTRARMDVQPPDTPPEMSLVVPERLLCLRGIKTLRIAFRAGQFPDGLSATITVLREE